MGLQHALLVGDTRAQHDHFVEPPLRHAHHATFIGDDEIARGVAAVKWLRADAAQQEWPWDELPLRLAALLRLANTAGN